MSEEGLSALRQASRAAFEAETKEGPRKVYVRFRIMNLSNLDGINGTVDIDLILNARWYVHGVWSRAWGGSDFAV